MALAKDLVGKRFGHLVVIARSPSRGNKAMWVCRCDCGNEQEVYGQGLRQGNTTRFRTCPNPIRRKERTRTRGGYMLVYPPEGYSGRTVKGGQVLEHRLVMEQILGRLLETFENVHHKNGVRDDNRPENLELWVTTQPKGQRPEDLVAWAKEILRRYDVQHHPGSEDPGRCG